MAIPISKIKFLTVLYISFALFPFFLGWMNLAYGIVLTVLLLFGLYNYYKSLDWSITAFYTKKSLIIAFLLIFVWVAFSGSGGMGYQYSDLNKLNTLILELTNHDWPISYVVDDQQMFLSHYLGFFLTGPTLFGFLGYKFVQLFQFFNALLGICLGFFWLGRFVKGKLAFFTLLFLIFGGVTIFAFLAKFGINTFSEIGDRIVNHGFVFWMNSENIIPLNYMAISDMFYWAPHHFIASILGIGIILNDTFIDKDIRFTPFLISLLAFWSPLVLVGILPFFLFALFYKRFEGIWHLTNLIVAPIIFAVVAIYLLAIESEELIKHFIFTDLSESGISIWNQIWVYLKFVFFEIIIWVIPIYFILKNKFNKGHKALFSFTVLLLLIIPLYRFGLWNDWCNRVSMPAIVVLALFAIKAFFEAKKGKKIVLAALFVLGMQAVSIGFIGSLIYSDFFIKFNPPYEHQVQTLPEVCESYGYPLTQFVAPENSLFFKYLAKKP